MQFKLTLKINYKYASLPKLINCKAFKILALFIINTTIDLLSYKLNLVKKWIKEVGFDIFKNIAPIKEGYVLDYKHFL